MELNELFDNIMTEISQEKMESFIELKTKVAELIESKTANENKVIDLENQLIAEKETVQRLSDTIAKYVKSINVNVSDIRVKDNDIDYDTMFNELVSKMY